MKACYYSFFLLSVIHKLVLAHPLNGEIIHSNISTRYSKQIQYWFTSTDSDNPDATKKIVGGSQTKKDAWPWMAILLYSNKINCGGTLITSHHILTAAHCADDGESPDQVRLGDYDIRYAGDTPEETYDVEWMKLHENYNKFTHENDIAIIKLTRAVK